MTKKTTSSSSKSSSKSSSSGGKSSSGKSKKYGSGAQKEVEKSVHKYKKGKAHSGPDKKKVKNRKQAIAIGLSKARKKGMKVPQKDQASN